VGPSRGVDLVSPRADQHPVLGAAVGSDRAAAPVPLRRGGRGGSPDVVLRSRPPVGRRSRWCWRLCSASTWVHDAMYGPPGPRGSLNCSTPGCATVARRWVIRLVLCWSGGFAPLIAAALLVAGSRQALADSGVFRRTCGDHRHGGMGGAGDSRGSTWMSYRMKLMSRIYLNAFDMGLRRAISRQACGGIPRIRVTGIANSGIGPNSPASSRPAGFDALFLADVLGAYDVLWRLPRRGPVRDAAQFSGSTTRPVPSRRMAGRDAEPLGFGITLSLTYEQPYSLARRVSTLDHLTGGRVAWNIVTSYLDSAARNLGLDAAGPATTSATRSPRNTSRSAYKLWGGRPWGARRRGARPGGRGVHRPGQGPRHRAPGAATSRSPGPFLCEPSPATHSGAVFRPARPPRGRQVRGGPRRGGVRLRPDAADRGADRCAPLRTAAAELGPGSPFHQGCSRWSPPSSPKPTRRPSPSWRSTGSSSAPQARWPSSVAGPASTLPSSVPTSRWRYVENRGQPVGRWPRSRPPTPERTWTVGGTGRRKSASGGRGPGG